MCPCLIKRLCFTLPNKKVFGKKLFLELRRSSKHFLRPKTFSEDHPVSQKQTSSKESITSFIPGDNVSTALIKCGLFYRGVNLSRLKLLLTYGLKLDLKNLSFFSVNIFANTYSKQYRLSSNEFVMKTDAIFSCLNTICFTVTILLQGKIGQSLTRDSFRIILYLQTTCFYLVFILLKRNDP